MIIASQSFFKKLQISSSKLRYYPAVLQYVATMTYPVIFHIIHFLQFMSFLKIGNIPIHCQCSTWWILFFLPADFLILFFTEALFYGGVAIFVFLIDKVWRPLQQVAPKSYIWSKSRFFRISSVTTMVLSLIIPLLAMGMVWPWTGPAASATLAPYLVGLVVQFAFEQYARHRKSPSWPVIPIIFKVILFLNLYWYDCIMNY